jgi:iron(II)-dependent oxidoreductase
MWKFGRKVRRPASIRAALLVGSLLTGGAGSSAIGQSPHHHRQPPAAQPDIVALIADTTRPEPVSEIPAGWFLMGSLRRDDDPFGLAAPYDDTEQPQRRIWLDAYRIDQHEVALGNYLAFLLRHNRPVPDELITVLRHVTGVHGVPPSTLAAWPAMYANWTEADAYCQAKGKRLPSEPEWEKAARGNEGALFPWGAAAPDATLAVFGYYHVHEVPLLAPIDDRAAGRSPYGLHHMAGNVAEWVQDWFGFDYYGIMPDRNPPGPSSGRYKVVRGGSWKSNPTMLRTATRGGAPPEQRAPTLGFRCAQKG